MSKFNCDGIIFDVDGVLIDVKESFLLSIKKTTEFVLKNWYNKKVNVTQKDIEAIKRIKGFNNDWDTTYALIELFMQGKPLILVKIVNKKTQQSKKYRDIRLIFDTFYWGSEFFIKQYKIKSPFANKYGLFKREKQLIEQSVLAALAKKYPLGIATGRNSFEVDYGLLTFKDIAIYIPKNNIVTENDTLFTKPNPDPLIEAKKRLRSVSPIYVGDTINDVLAARNAKMPCIYIGKEKLGDYQLENVNQIMEVLQ